jgi:hypothetical protein
MHEAIFKSNEMKEVFGYLDALQIRNDSLLYSHEDPENDRTDNEREKSISRLTRCFGKGTLSNKEVDLVLREIHRNFLGVARQMLLVEGEGGPDLLRIFVNGKNGVH